MVRTGAVVLAVCLASCHLGDKAEPEPCAAGTQQRNGVCQLDAPTGPTITVSPAGAAVPCGVSPATVTVPPSGDFGFKNDDEVDHIISGKDGTLWTTAKAGQLSPLIGITRVGTWPYEVSGCPTGGTIVVE